MGVFVLKLVTAILRVQLPSCNHPSAQQKLSAVDTALAVLKSSLKDPGSFVLGGYVDPPPAIAKWSKA
jgi:hypothetical protein